MNAGASSPGILLRKNLALNERRKSGEGEPPWAVREVMRFWADPRLPRTVRPKRRPS